jgi:hypothetical protein
MMVAAVSCLAVLAVVVPALAAVALILQYAGTPAAGSHTQGRDALWLGHAWVDGRKTPADAARLAGQLRGTGIRDLYVHVGPLEGGLCRRASPGGGRGGCSPSDDGGLCRRASPGGGRGGCSPSDDGGLDPALRPRSAAMVRALHGAIPSARVLAWIGGVVGPQGLDLSRRDVRERIGGAASQVLLDGFDGVHYDLEPAVSGDPGLLALLEATRAKLAARGAALSVAAAKVEALPGLATAAALGSGRSGTLWSADYLGMIARRVDQVVLMAYDTGLPLQSLYGGYVARQTRLALRSVPQTTELLVGVPAFHDENLGHHARAETIAAALRGVRLGLAGDLATRRFGVALYVDFAATDADWRAYREGWVRA